MGEPLFAVAKHPGLGRDIEALVPLDGMHHHHGIGR
jgi:hypothetical protein